MLLTGADGFTGQHFAPRAEAAGYDVFSFRADLTNAQAVQSEVLEIKPDLVVHLAAISFVAHADQAEIYDVNVIGTTNLLDSLTKLEMAPGKVLLASSANVYGNSEKSPVSEDDCPAPINHYAMSKLAMEYMARNYLDKLPIFFTRPFNYTGVGQSNSFVLPKIIKHFKEKSKVIELGNIEVEREFNDVDYVCDAYLALLKLAKTGEIYNICSGKTYSLQLILTLLEDMTGHTMELKTNPDFVRTNEIKSLCGDPTKLNTAIDKARTSLPYITIEDTLKKML